MAALKDALDLEKAVKESVQSMRLRNLLHSQPSQFRTIICPAPTVVSTLICPSSRSDPCLPPRIPPSTVVLLRGTSGSFANLSVDLISKNVFLDKLGRTLRGDVKADCSIPRM